MTKALEHKTFVIAGGSKGIGLAITRQLLAANARVHVYSRTIGDLPESANLEHHVCDFVNDDLTGAAVPETIHGVAYCPGTINLRSFRSLKPKDFEDDFAVNVLGAVKFLQPCMAALKKGAEEQPTGVVLFSTVAVGVGLPMHASIAAAKGAIEGMTRSLAAEWAPHIRVNCIAPALTDTPLSSKLLATDEKRSAMAAKYPLGKVGDPEDLANMATLLLGPAGSWITGQVVGVDGGMSAVRN